MANQPMTKKLFELEMTGSRIVKGRHACGCQARKHPLVRNCLNCGRIVCLQEGSGSCFTCGKLVCTREERAILELNNKQSYELLNTLMPENSTDGPSLPVQTGLGLRQGPAKGLAAIGESMRQANEFREKLLEADRDRERTHVNDLESDYFSLENNVYLSADEREAIIRRKEELRDLAQKNRRLRILDLDIANRTAESKAVESVETVHDPVIQQILSDAQDKSLVQTDSKDLAQLADFVKDFVPKYQSAERTKGGKTNKPSSIRKPLPVTDESSSVDLCVL